MGEGGGASWVGEVRLAFDTIFLWINDDTMG